MGARTAGFGALQDFSHPRDHNVESKIGTICTTELVRRHNDGVGDGSTNPFAH